MGSQRVSSRATVCYLQLLTAALRLPAPLLSAQVRQLLSSTTSGLDKKLVQVRMG